MEICLLFTLALRSAFLLTLSSCRVIWPSSSLISWEKQEHIFYLAWLFQDLCFPHLFLLELITRVGTQKIPDFNNYSFILTPMRQVFTDKVMFCSTREVLLRPALGEENDRGHKSWESLSFYVSAKVNVHQVFMWWKG